jgi:microcystin-dependent protein
MKKKLIFPILMLFLTMPLTAQEGFIGEIKMFAGNFAPRSWALCDGQLLSISQNTALFSILGTTYGGDGRTTFGLPDLRGRVSIHPGTGPGLSRKTLGEEGGYEAVTLSAAQMPAHTHTARINADTTVASSDRPENKLPARNAAATPQYGENMNSTLSSTAVSVGNTGGSQAHTNMQPYTVVNYIICISGYYPSRN